MRLFTRLVKLIRILTEKPNRGDFGEIRGTDETPKTLGTKIRRYRNEL